MTDEGNGDRPEAGHETRVTVEDTDPGHPYAQAALESGNPETYRFEAIERHPETDEATLRETYGPLVGWFRYRAADYEDLDDALRASRTRVPVDEYLAGSLRLAVGGVAVGILLGTLVAFAGGYMLDWSLLLGVPAGALLGGIVGGAGTWGVRRYAPVLRARRRARKTDFLLPQTVVFLYALSHGGMDLYESMERLGDSADVYGAAARTFHDVIDDVRWFDRDLFEAIAAAQDAMPGEMTRTFLDELVSVLETGGDVDQFLESEADRYRELAETKHERLLEDLQTLAEVYVTVVFAGPIFLLVILMVAGLLWPGVLLPLELLVYVGIPLAVLAVGAWASHISEPRRQEQGGGELRALFGAIRPSDGSFEDDRIATYESQHRETLWNRFRDRPRVTLRKRPAAVLFASVPLAAIVGIALYLVDPLSVPVPVARGTALAAAPFVIAASPFAYFYERKRRHERRVRKRFPTALEILAEGNENGLPISESLELVTTRTTGELASELDRVRRDVDWQHDAVAAFERFADRIAVPEIRRSTRLVTESLRTTNHLAPVLEIVADNLRTRNELRAERRRYVRPYALVVVIGIAVYLGIVVFFDAYFLPVIADLSERGTSGTLFVGSRLELAPISGEVYRRLFFHSVLIQAALNGLLLGKLIDGHLASGVKYAAGLVAASTLVFVLAL